ncbi:hypothetical protein KXW57_004350 [Aspergillus fumigatus]|nr:hypothetical protein KXV98_009695 [Aspergillus fumigatus]KAH3263712.1 hypothetical protein KXW57_004350 [Aspergillus fumigatus]KAJ8239521.1 hypothetical protein LV160_003890 [Aspergillus fumigatus]
MFFGPHDPFVQTLAEKAVVEVKRVSTEFGLPCERASGIVKLALYDFVILCDNSFSMRNHKEVLENTLLKLARLSTLLAPGGISIRFPNHWWGYNGDSDNLLTAEAVRRQFAEVSFYGRSKLGTTLRKKIVQPMIRKAEERTLKRPVITMIITDGEPYGERRETLRDTIQSCKQSVALQSYGKAAAVFVVSRIGNSTKADQFIAELQSDKSIANMTYCSREALDEQQEVFKQCGDNNRKYAPAWEAASSLGRTSDASMLRRRINPFDGADKMRLLSQDPGDLNFLFLSTTLFHPFQAIHMSHAMEDDALHQLQQEQSKLLDKIDELRTIGVGGLVELPQLIVCGNQSSGKSSVLEAITRVRFPAKSNVCTRFATEVILRRNAAFSKIKVSIEPGPSRTDEDERRRLRSFTYEDFSNGDDLPPLIEKAKVHMGITESVNTGFSDDVLKVEISGPDKPELTLVDLPGLYYSTSQEQDLQGILIVRKLTERYMSNPRSIILAVISAKTDYHLQEVLNIAEQFDPKRERTLGIITQPDILEANSEEEDTYLHFVKNEKIPLELGWHVLRNRSFETRDISDDARDEMEKAFFNQGRWASLSRECVGIESLRRRLSGVLLKLIRRNLPGLITEIQDKVSDRQQRLSKLGPGRSTLQQQRGYLLGISSKFERITMQALNGMYADDFFGGLDGTSSTEDFRRLRAVIRQLNEYFADAMAIRGCRRKIVDVHPLFGKNHHKLAAGNPYTDIWEPEYVERSSLEAEVSKQARNNRGIELPGNANQLLVGSLFRDQSKPWEGLAKEHLMKAWESARYFTWLVLQHITDDHTSSLLIGSIIDPELERLKQSLLEKLDELTAYAKRGHPLPLGKSFLSQVQKARSNRQLESLRSKLLFAGSEGNEGELYTMKDIEQATSAMETSRDEFAAAEIIDQMQAYYETAIVTFVDNVAILGIENCLLDPLQRIFTSQVVNNMDDGQVRELSMEPPYIHAERERLAWELDKLQAGLRALRVFTPQKPSFSSLPPLIKKPAPGLSNGLNPSEKSPPAPTMPSYHGKPFAGKEWSELLSSPGPAKDNRKYAKSKSPKPSSVPESAGTSSAPFGNLFGPGLPEHKVAPVVFGAGEFEHKRFCMDVSTNPREEKHDSGASGTSISENKSVFGGHRTKV